MMLMVVVVGKMEGPARCRYYFEWQAHHFPAASPLPPKKKRGRPKGYKVRKKLQADDEKWTLIRVIPTAEKGNAMSPQEL